MSKSIVTNYEWRDIAGYEGLYQVSSDGKVRSVKKLVVRGNNSSYYKKEQDIKATDNGYGYLIVSLNKNAIRKNHYVHRIVAEAFIPNPDNKAQVNHLDHNRKNNNVDNLEWVTCAENIRYSAHLQKKPRLNGKKTDKKMGTGIRLKNGKYEVYICHKYLGRYLELEDAQKVRDEYVKEYYHEV